MIRVGDEGKGKVKFCFKFQVAFLIIGADAEDGKTGGAQQGVVVAQIAGLYRAGGCVVLWIENRVQLVFL